MGIIRQIARSTPPPRRRRKADPTKPRSISARLRNRNPCAACKHSRQKCSGGPPLTCSQCAAKGNACEPGRLEPQFDDQALSIRTEARFIYEDGRNNFTRIRQRSNTLETNASSVISPISEVDCGEDNVLSSPILPTGLPSSSFMPSVCESPTTEDLASRFSSFTVNQFAATQSMGAHGSISEESNQELCQQVLVTTGQLAQKAVDNCISPLGVGLLPSSAASEVVTSGHLLLSISNDSTGSSMNVAGCSTDRFFESDGYVRTSPSSEGLQGAFQPTSSALPAVEEPVAASMAIVDTGLFDDHCFSTWLSVDPLGDDFGFGLGLGPSNLIEGVHLFQDHDDIFGGFQFC